MADEEMAIISESLWDCAYPGVKVLSDGTFILTTYGHWSEGEAPFIVCVRLNLDELDELNQKSSKGFLSSLGFSSYIYTNRMHSDTL